MHLGLLIFSWSVTAGCPAGRAQLPHQCVYFGTPCIAAVSHPRGAGGCAAFLNPNSDAHLIQSGSLFCPQQVLAGALKDNRRAGVAGEDTFGKGLIQVRGWLNLRQCFPHPCVL